MNQLDKQFAGRGMEEAAERSAETAMHCETQLAEFVNDILQ